jgi:hypothetical protein
MRFFDPTGIETTQLTKADVVRSSIRGVPESGHAALVGAFTKTGAAKFCALTRQLARRGSRLHQTQYLAFEVAGRIYAKPAIDYKLFPNGVCGSPGFEVVMPLNVARRLALLIRS